MGRPPCCDKSNVKRGLWTAEEDAKILAYISTHGTGNWTAVPKKAGLKRCGKSCRLRWTNYLRPDLKHESFTTEEEQMILSLHATLGSRWSIIAAQLPGRTDNDVKNYWNTKLRKKLLKMGIDPVTHKPISQIIADYGRIGLLKGGCSSSNTTTTNNKCGPAPYQTLNTTRISCFNRGLKNAFMPRWGQVQTPLHSGSNFSITTTATTEPTQDGLLSNTPWDLLTQLQAIQQVASSYNNQQTFQTHFFSESSSSSSSSTSLSNHQGKIRTNVPPPFPCQPSQPQNTSSSTSTSATSFSWSDFLSDEAFLPPNYREEDFPAVSSTESSSNKRIHDEIFSPNPQFGYTAPDNLKCNGVTEIGNGASAYQHGYVGGSCDGNTGAGIGQTLGAPPDDCFVETILERDSAMLWEFPDLLDNP